MPNLYRWTGLSALGGPTLSKEDVENRLARFSMPQILGAIQRIDLLLHKDPRFSAQTQDAIGEGFFGGRWQALRGAATESLARTGDAHQPPILFHEQQILTAVKLSIRILPRLPIGQTQEPLAVLGEALLAITDLLERESDSVANEENAFSLEFVQEITLNSALNEQTLLAEHLPFMIRFYLDKHHDLQHFPEWVDIAQLMSEATGLSPSELILAGVMAYSYFIAIPSETYSKGAIPLQPDRFFSSTTFDAAKRASLLGLVANDAHSLHLAFREAESRNALGRYNFGPLVTAPLISVDGNHFLASTKLLLRRFTTDLHFVLLDALDGRTSESKRYLDFRGRVLEKMLLLAVRQIVLPRKTRHRPPRTRVLSIDSAVPPSDNRPRADVVFWTDAGTIVADAKSVRLNSRVINGSAEAFRDLIEGSLVRACTQIEMTADTLHTGRFAFASRARPRQGVRIVPLIVTAESIGWNPVLARWLNERLAAQGVLQGPRFAPVQVAPLYSLERLIALSGDPVGALVDKATDRQFSSDSLHNFIAGTPRDWPDPGRVIRPMREAMETAIQELRRRLAPSQHTGGAPP